LRTRGTDNGSLIPPAATAENGATQVVLAFDDNRLASTLFGQYGQHLALIERRLGVVADSRGSDRASSPNRLLAPTRVIVTGTTSPISDAGAIACTGCR